MKAFFRFAMLALVLVAVALVSALTAMRFAIHGQVVEVPAVVGLTPSDAERAVAGLGLQLEVERQYYSPQIPEGRIMTQMPLPGMKVRRGWQVRVGQSLGPQRVVIPDVTKQSERAAELNIQRRGLELASTAEMQMPGTPADQVLAQSPPANASQVAAPRTSLLVTVAADPPAYVMPNFVGQPLGSASHTLQDAGFKLGTVSMAPPETNPAPASPGTVNSVPPSSLTEPQPSPASMIVTQWPPAGQRILAGAVLNFEVK
ncbi:MAG TPA: PASTA domain-containing protein [Candidatus Dormibacteraeota bacterium]|jgi:beta-lactam-binding protein with PASTA domain|nr:PASTA domain-containing protein [Candidatus Dormibacteraeota bacterium]